MYRLNKRNKLACGGRKKAFLGSLISAGTSIVGGLINSNASKKAQEEAERQQRNQMIMQRNNQLVSVYNSALAGNRNLSNVDETNNVIFKCGGRKKALNGKRTKLTTPYITDGGIAIPLGKGLTLLRGFSHDEINESGKTGIGIQVGKNQIEAQDGEIAQKKNKELRIFSDEPILNGISPADAVEAGYDPNKIFTAQEIYKKVFGLKDDGSIYKLGGRRKCRMGSKTPVEGYRRKFADGGTTLSNITVTANRRPIPSDDIPIYGNNNLGLDIKTSDWINLGTDVLGSIGVGLINNAATKRAKYNYIIPQYVDEVPVAFDTTYYNGAQRTNVERNRINSRNIIGQNTVSSNAAVQKMRESDTEAMLEQNKLWDEKANKEIELRNLQSQNEQAVRARNAQARNNYYSQVAEIRNREIDQNNAAKLQQSQALSSSLAGISQAATNFLTQAGQRYEDNQTLRALAASRGSILPSMLSAGVDFDNSTLAGMLYNYEQQTKEPLVAPNRSDYSTEAEYNAAVKRYDTNLTKYKQIDDARNLVISKLGRNRKGRNYLTQLGLY